MNGELVFRFRIHYAKGAALQYISHLDLQRTWERIFRRAALPLAFTQGFHPHPRLNLGLALALGWTSEYELLEVWLTEHLPAEVLQSKIEAASPPSMAIISVTNVPVSAPNLQKQIQSAVYQVRIPAEICPPDLSQRIVTLLAAETLPRKRRDKTYDLRPLVEELSLSASEQECSLRLAVTALPSATGRPDEVLLELGVDPLAAGIHRIELVLQEP